MIEKPTKEWVERISTVFGRYKPKSITIRGDESGIHFNKDEIALGGIHFKTKKFYRKNQVGSYYKRIEHLYTQERSLYLLCDSFQISIEDVVGQSIGNHDFIARPIKGSYSYEAGLADLIFISEIEELPFLLDFQYYNNVVVEETDPVYFLQIIRTYVILYLQDRFPIVDQTKIRAVLKWIYDRLSEIDAEERVRFYWYKKEYVAQTPNSLSAYLEGQEKLEPKITLTLASNQKSASTAPLNQPDSNSSFPRIKFDCSKVTILEYFELLKMDHPVKNESLLNDEAIDWMVKFYFGKKDAQPTEKPEFVSLMGKQDWKFFIYQFSTSVSAGSPYGERTSLLSLLEMLKEVFPKEFPGNCKTYVSNISSQVKNMHGPIKSILNFDEQPDLKRRFGFSITT